MYNDCCRKEWIKSIYDIVFDAVFSTGMWKQKCNSMMDDK